MKIRNMKQDKFPAGEILSLDQAIPYADHSIVSRQVIRKEAGNVSLFAFDKGESLSEHTAPYDALVQVIDGTAEIIINGKKFWVESGQSIIMPANVPHSVNAGERFKMLLTMIRVSG